jgi:hypothetical protein
MNNQETLYEAALTKVSRGDESAEADALKAFERVDQMLSLIHRIRAYGTPAFGFSAAIIAIVHLIGWGYSGFHADYWLATPVASALGWVIALLVLAGLSMSLWDILLIAERAGFAPSLLTDPKLKPFNDCLQSSADGAIQVFDHIGVRIDGPVFSSAWAIILFSQIPTHRRFRLPNAAKIYPDQLKVLSNAATIPPKAERAKPKKLHWMAPVNKRTYLSKAGRIAGHWHGRQSEQVKFALRLAFERTRKDANPFVTATELENEIAEALRQAQMPVGLGETESSEWINKMFGNGSRHDYAWVRRFLTEPDFVPPYELPLGD